ncbi:sensor histidine kinase [Egicoccus sp. AB-alg6-2]|uniref:sensor histidine kinase n=1 Tax=Egicoccus sp. AB-alg6-2 TaxID=3242692 RepID=UPI00359EAEB2
MPVTLRRIPVPPATDVAIAVVFAVIGQAVTWHPLEVQTTWVGSRPMNAVLNLFFMATLAWRRRAPLAAVSLAVGVYLLPMLVVPHDMSFLAGGVPLILLTASAGYYSPRRRAILALVIGLMGLAAASLSTPELRSWDAFAWNTGFMLVPWLGARGMREREDRAAALATELTTERASREAARREAAAAERAHIARELHDIVAHSVSMMVIQIGAARVVLPAGAADARTPLLDAEATGRQTLDDLRRLLGVLRADPDGDLTTATGPAAPQPGLSELEALLAPVRETGLDVEVKVHGQRVVLPAALDLTAYRIVQEGLTNTLKHSGASRVTVRLTYTPTTLHIDLVDDGTAAHTDGAGHGLVGISERASLFGGSVSAGRADDGGWKVQTRLPLPAPQERHAPALPAP